MDTMNGGDTSENGEVTIGDGDPDPSETLRILVATDNHLGFGEKYPERQNDSFASLVRDRLVVARNGDWFILAHDLLDEIACKQPPTPRQDSLRCTQTWYCVGPAAVQSSWCACAWLLVDSLFRHSSFVPLGAPF